MGCYVNRNFVCSRLRLGLRQSYRLLPSCYGAMISTDDMLDLINSARRQIAEPLADVPTDLMTAEELASVPELANSGVTAHKLLNWTRRRTKKVPPHFFISQQTVRFSKSRFLAWLDALAKRRRVA